MSSSTTGQQVPLGTGTIELEIGGMTCASCAARVEKKLNKLEGVTATVNYATEKARVSFPSSLTPEDLVATVEKTGYTATVPAPPPEDDATASAVASDDPTRALRQRLLVSAALSVPVVALAMVPAWQFTYWQ